MKKHLGSLLLFLLLNALKALASEDINISDLVDQSDSFPEEAFDIQMFLPYLYGMLFFILGFIVATLNIGRFFHQKTTIKHPYHDRLKACKDEKTLLRLLLSLDEKRFKPTIIELEQAIYANQKVDFKALKEQLLKP